jgi:hypothetical protein
MASRWKDSTSNAEIELAVNSEKDGITLVSVWDEENFSVIGSLDEAVDLRDELSAAILDFMRDHPE